MQILRRPFATLALCCFTGLVSAQQKASVIQDRDEPGRNPYQQSVELVQNTTNCGGLLAQCVLVFDPVPAGKRLVVTHVSVLFHTDPLSSNPLAYVGAAQIPNFAHYLPLPQARGGTRHVTSDSLLFAVEPGATPYVAVQALPATDGKTASASLSGYYVSTP